VTRYLVTGATGNLGGLTVEAHLKAISAAEVSVLARDPGKAAGLKDHGVNVVKGEYFDYESLVSAFSGVDKVLLTSAVSLASNSRPQSDEP